MHRCTKSNLTIGERRFLRSLGIDEQTQQRVNDISYEAWTQMHSIKSINGRMIFPTKAGHRCTLSMGVLSFPTKLRSSRLQVNTINGSCVTSHQASAQWAQSQFCQRELCHFPPCFGLVGTKSTLSTGDLSFPTKPWPSGPKSILSIGNLSFTTKPRPYGPKSILSTGALSFPTKPWPSELKAFLSTELSSLGPVGPSQLCQQELCHFPLSFSPAGSKSTLSTGAESLPTKPRPIGPKSFL